MDKVTDTVTSVFHIAMKDKRPVICPSDGAIVWSETFGLGWRLGIAFNSRTWFQKIHLHLDHNNTQTQQDLATVTTCLRDTADKSVEGHRERTATIPDFGHGEPALLGSWTPSDITSYPYVSVTLTTKARLPEPAATPLSSTSLALCQSLWSGEFIDTKFYVFSVKRPGFPASRPRVVYANSTSIGVVLPKSTLGTDTPAVFASAHVITGEKRVTGSSPAFMVNMTSDHLINRDSVLHEYEYEQDSDLDDEESTRDEDDCDSDLGDMAFRCNLSGNLPRSRPESSTRPHGFKSPGAGVVYDGAEDEFPEPPAYSASNCRMILIKGVAYRTWLSYIHFRYTGQVSFRALKSTLGGSPRHPSSGSVQAPACSPKSMYRLAATLGDEKMKELARRAIYQGLSKDNIIEEAFSWFTAQYAIISEYEVEQVVERRKSPEVSSALRQQLKAVSLGEKPWAQNVLIAIMDQLNTFEPTA